MSIFTILLLSIFSAKAQNASSFPMAYQEASKCLEDASVEVRGGCYSICKKAAVSKTDLIQCSRLERDTERQLFSQNHEIEQDEALKNFQGVVDLGCKLLNLSKRDEVKMNECIAEQYMEKEKELLATQKN
jgi:hypothetical protein